MGWGGGFGRNLVEQQKNAKQRIHRSEGKGKSAQQREKRMEVEAFLQSRPLGGSNVGGRPLHWMDLTRASPRDLKKKGDVWKRVSKYRKN